LARIEESRGKSAKLVCAARIRIPVVESCRSHHAGPGPKTDRPICESTDSELLGIAPATRARNDVPMNIVASRIDMIAIVVRAFFHSGGLNAGTPLVTASVPVMAEHPSAKARITRRRPSDSGAMPVAGTTPETTGASPMSVRTTPMAISERVSTRKT